MTQLPAATLSTDAMVDIAIQWINVIADKLKTEYAHYKLQDHIRELLKRGTLPTIAVIDAARRGNPDADFALRKRIAEMIDAGEELPTSLKAFNQEALFRGPPGRARGEKNIADLYTRDLGISVMVEGAIVLWNLRPTRNRASTKPSASTIVARALTRRGVTITEWQVEKIYRQFGTIASRLSETIPLN